jgi:hypothetical protein
MAAGKGRAIVINKRDQTNIVKHSSDASDRSAYVARVTTYVPTTIELTSNALIAAEVTPGAFPPRYGWTVQPPLATYAHMDVPLVLL